MYLLGFDIGGTKCAVITARYTDGQIRLLKKEKCDTDLQIPPEEMIERLIAMADGILEQPPAAIGISCGGPLNSRTGVIMSPPNLPGWDNVPIVRILEAHYPVKAHLQNDANACAVAEWKFGAGRGVDNLIFLTFGTGLGAGLILNGQLYAGTHDNAGEAGHIRLERFGPVGYGKAGSFEGFCSGSGLAQLGYMKAMEKLQSGSCPAYFHPGMTPAEVTAKTVAQAAEQGDETALEVYRICAAHLGMGLSVLMDLLDPELIVIGSIYARQEKLLWEGAKAVIDAEALLPDGCRVVPARLGEQIGDYAAIATALL